MDRSRIQSIRERLLAWFAGAARDLPWRRTRDPYAIWVSEIMLQQTRVDTVVPYYQRFLTRFPTVQSLADAPADDVLAHWQGLGYYSRARNLQKAARQVVESHGARLPADVAALRSLPGIGRYTAGAIASIAFDRAEPILDGNVARVLSRLFAIAGDPKDRDVSRELWRLAGRLVPTGAASSFNQGMMELGALVCIPTRPACDVCPLRGCCDAHRQGRVEELPTPTRRVAVVPVTRHMALVRRRGRVLWMRRAQGLLRGMWEMPSMDAEEVSGLPDAVASMCGVSVCVAGDAFGKVSHVFTHRRMTAWLYPAKATRGRARAAVDSPYDAARWLPPGLPQELGVSKLMRKAVALADRAGGFTNP